MQNTVARPRGVTILAVLALIGGVLGLLFSLLLILGSAVTADAGVMLYAIISLVIALGELAFGIGAWTLRPWAWTIGVGVEALSIVLSVVSVVLGWSAISSVVVSIVIAAIILYYLFTAGVKAAFGRA